MAQKKGRKKNCSTRVAGTNKGGSMVRPATVDPQAKRFPWRAVAWVSWFKSRRNVWIIKKLF